MWRGVALGAIFVLAACFSTAPAAPDGASTRAADLRSRLNAAAEQEPISAGRLLPSLDGYSETVGETRIIDADKRYVSWLEKQTPLAAVSLAGNVVNARSLGGNILTDPRIFDQVSALVQNSNDTFCSGVLISRRVVLTAAHCVCLDPQRVIFGIRADSIAADSFDVTKVWKPNKAKCGADEQSARSRAGRDYGLILLAGPVERSTVFVPALLAPSAVMGAVKTGDTLHFAGFGRTSLRGLPGQKTYVRLPVISPRCVAAADAKYGCAYGAELVSQDHRRFGPCFGDSGGAAFIEAVNANGAETLFVAALSARLISSPSASRPTKCGDGAILTLLTPNVQDAIRSAARSLSPEAIP